MGVYFIFLLGILIFLLLFSFLNQKSIRKQVNHQEILVDLAKEQTELIKNFNMNVNRFEDELSLLRERVRQLEK